MLYCFNLFFQTVRLATDKIHVALQLTIRGSGKLKQTITKLLALPGGIKKLILSGTVGVTLCRRNCHVDPHKIETCFRTFPKFKPFNAPHLYLTQIGVG